MGRMNPKLLNGWNTWNSRSVLSHVLMPYAFNIQIGVKSYQNGTVLLEGLVGGTEGELIRPGVRSVNGDYTELTVQYGGMEFKIHSAACDGQQYILVTPIVVEIKPSALLISASVLWNYPGYARKTLNHLEGIFEDNTICVYCSGQVLQELNTGITAPYISVALTEPIAISTGCAVSVSEVTELLQKAKEKLETETKCYGELAEAFHAMRSCLSWDTIYEPEKAIVCSPVSRVWSKRWGGYVLFCWDTYFSSMLAIPIDKELAYANAIAITREKTEQGFIPNFGAANGDKSGDRSQPPVGALAVREIYRKYHETWIVEELFDDLLEWNRWFAAHRMLDNGQMCWGSEPFPPHAGKYWETEGVNSTYGAALESGMDNSPMYDGVPFDTDTHLMCLADVGLTGLYIMDCRIMAELASLINRDEDRTELLQRMELSETGLMQLWCEEVGMFLNKRTDTGEFSRRISPTNFYALFSNRVSVNQMQKITEHFYRPEEFWGDYMLPTIARNDAAYSEQDYWRGRIWAPTNFLVYLALKHQKLQKECSIIAEKSAALLLGEWERHGHVHENYNGDSGAGCDVINSDPFYHWGGLLALIGLMEKGYM